MKVKIDIDDQYEGTSITIQTNEWTEELQALVQQLQAEKPQRIFGIDGDQTILLQPDKIDFFYVENRKVYAALATQRLEVRSKLFELEEMLAAHYFMRFSKSVLGNINNIERFELSFSGNLCVFFQSGRKEYISRKYVAGIKDKLLMGGVGDDA